jgi:hypothetical protein
MFAVLANDPLPYRPIKIVDVSPFRSSVRTKRAGANSSRRVRTGIAGAIVAAVAVATFSASAGAAPAASSVAGEFRLGPGHVMPASLVEADADASGEFRLGPGHVMPASLAQR